MKLSLVTVVFDAETGAFPADPLAGIEGEVVSVVEHFFTHAGLPHLLLVVHHRPAQSRDRGGRSRSSGQRAVDALTEEDRALFDRLRAWRQSRAHADGVPVYVVMNNAQLADIARRRPRSRAGGQPQQERARQPERQPRFSRGELTPGRSTMSSHPAPRPVEAASRSGLLRPGVDQTPAPCLVPLSVWKGSGTESPLPGGGPRVAAGLLRGDER